MNTVRYTLFMAIVATFTVGLCLVAFSQAPVITTYSPARNASSVSTSSTISLTWSQNMNFTTLNNTNIQVRGSIRGQLYSNGATVNNNGSNQVTMIPNASFRPGELITVRVTNAQSIGGTPIVSTAQYSFRAAATGGTRDFSRKDTYNTGGETRSVVFGDIDNDGDVDMVSSMVTPNQFIVHTNNGNGIFTTGATYSLGANVRGILLGDIDSDGDLDVVVARNGNPMNAVIYLNNGAGTFAFSSDVAFSSGNTNSSSSHFMTLADINRDGHLDILAVGVVGLYVRINNGNGTFATETVYATTIRTSVGVGDIDNDGDIDVVIGGGTAGMNTDFLIYKNNGDGTLVAAGNFTGAGNASTRIELADLNNDGFVDFVSSSISSPMGVIIRLNDGTGGFGTAATLSNGNSTNSQCITDIDGDGDLDILFDVLYSPGPYSDLRQNTNNGSGAFTYQGNISTSNSGIYYAISSSDIDNDGDMDLAVADASGRVIVMFNANPPSIASFTPTTAMQGADIVIAGANFNGATAVRFGGVNARYFRVVSDSKIIAGVPANATSGNVEVVTSLGTGTLAGFTFHAPEARSNATLFFADIAGTANIGSVALTTATINTNAISNPTSIRHVYYDVSNNYVYWAHDQGGSSTLRRARPNGTEIQNSFVTTDQNARGIVSANGYMYWVRNSANSIARANIDGTNIEQNFVTGLGNGGQALKFYNNQLYWLEDNAGAVSIKRINADGSGGISTVLTFTGNSFEFDIDLQTGQIYYADYTHEQVFRAENNGTGIVSIFNATTNDASLSGFGGIAVYGGYVYVGALCNVSGSAQPRIVRFRPDGSALNMNYAVTDPIPATLMTVGRMSVGTLPAIATAPATTPTGANVSITGTNFNFITNVRIGNTDAIAINVLSPTQMNAVFAVETSGTLEVVSLLGRVTSGSIEISNIQPPTITSISTQRTITGASITITGTNLDKLTEVRFFGVGGTRAVAIATSASTQIQVTVPSGVTQMQGNIYLANEAGNTTATSIVTIVSLPIITSLSQFATTTGQTISVLGQNLQFLDEIRFFGVSGAIASVVGASSATQIQIVVPTGINATSGNIAFRNIAGTTLSQTIEIIAPPVITSVTPLFTQRGAVITVSGANLQYIDTLRTFNSNGAIAGIQSRSANQLTALVPSNSFSEGVVFLRNIAGSTTSSQIVRVVDAPIITSVTPARTHTGGTVTITGFNLQFLDEVRFFGNGGNLGEVTSTSATSIQVRVPTMVSQPSGNVFVRNISGLANAPAAIEVVFPPVISSVSNSVTTTGQTITIIGQNLQYLDEIRFFGMSGVMASVVGTSSATQVQITVPAGITITSGSVYLRNIGGTTLSPTIEIIAPPVVQNIVATAAYPGAVTQDLTTGRVLTTTGGTITLTGQNLAYISEVRFFGATGVSTAVVSATPTQVVVQVPAGITQVSGKVFVRNLSASSESIPTVEIVRTPIIIGINPTLTATGQTISLTGEHLQWVTDARFFGEIGIAGTIVSTSATALTIQLPTTASATSGQVWIRNQAGTTLSTQIVELIQVPSILTVSSLQTGTGATFTLTGTNLQNITEVRFFGVSGVRATVISSTATQLVVTVPENISQLSGQVFVRNLAGTALSPQTITLIAAPVITSVSPLIVSVGSTLTIEGQHLSNITVVRFFGENGTTAAIQTNSATIATVTVPATTTASGRIFVQTPGGSTLSAQTVELLLPPTITSVSSLITTTGATLTISGANLDRITEVRFFGASGTRAIAISTVASTQIQVVVPNGITQVAGNLYIANGAGNILSGDVITIIAPPRITGISPLVTTTGQTISVLGSELGNITEARFFSSTGVLATIQSSSATQINLVVPSGLSATSGSVFVKNIAGEIISAQIVEIVASPVITSVAPLAVGVNDIITISGNNLQRVNVVKFFGNSGVNAEIIATSGTVLQVRVPAGIIGTSGQIFVENIAGNTLSPQTVQLILQPAIATVTPQITTTGQTLTITGENLQFVSNVQIAGIPAIVVSASSATQIQVQVPAGITAESGVVRLSNSIGFAESSTITIVRPPQIAAVNPNISRIGHVITITGQNLQYLTGVRFFGATGVAGEILSSTATQAVLKVPSGITVTGGNIFVENIAGTALSPQTIIQLPLPLLVYWSNGGNALATGNINSPTSVNTSFISSLNNPSGIFVDVVNGFIYWAEEGQNRIGRANLDGTSINNSFVTGLSAPRDIFVNAGLGFIYWINGGTNTIERAELANPNATQTTNFIRNIGTPTAFTFHNGFFYITESLFNSIRRIGSNGGFAASFIPAAQAGFAPNGVSVVGDELYWLVPNDGIRKRAIAGGTVSTIINSAQLGSSNTQGLATFDGKMYWADRTGGTIRRAGTNGSNVETIFTGASSPRYPHIGKDITATPPTIASFTPTSGWTGRSITITGSGFKNQSHVLAVRFGTEEASYVVNSDTEITAVVGIGASGAVSIQTLGGGASLDGFTFIGPPSIAGISPTEGAIGTNVSITGTNLDLVTTVKFFGASGTPATIVSQSPAEIVVAVPAGVTGQGQIHITAPSGEALSGQNFRVISTPIIASVAPLRGITGATVTITGSHLDRLSSVRFFGASGTPATITSSNANQIVVTVPNGITQPSGNIAVTNLAGTTSAGQVFSLIQPPVVTAVSTTQTLGGAQITLTGSGFNDVSTVRFFGNNGVTALFTATSDNQLTVTVPFASVGQSGAIFVQNPAGTALSEQVSVVALPTISAINPLVTKVGDTITITGTQLASATIVRFFGNSGVSATIYSKSANSIQVVVPAGISGQSGQVFVENPAGGVLSAQAVQVLAPPTITSVTPTFVPVNGTLTIQGTNLDNIVRVRLFGATGTEVPIISKTAGQALVSVPASVAGLKGRVFVENIAGTALSIDTITVSDPLNVTSVTPTLTTTGASIQLQGTGLSTLTEVRFFGASGVRAIVQSSTSTVAQVLVPMGISGRFGQIYVANAGGNQLVNTPLEIVYPPIITAVSNSFTATGRTLTLSGSELQHVQTVRFFGAAGIEATIVSKTPTQVVVTVPVTAGGSGQIYVSNIAGFALSPTVQIVATPAITGISPVRGARGSEVILTGTNLQLVDTARFFGSNGVTATIAGGSATELRVQVPMAANGSGQIYVANVAGSALSPAFEIIQPPVVTSLGASRTHRGASLVVNGTNLQYVDTVRFFGATGIIATIESKTSGQLVVTVPNGISGTGQIYVANAAGFTQTPAIEIVEPPVITGVSSVLTRRGANITISGTNLQYVDTVRFFGATGEAAGIFQRTATQLVVSVPSNASGSGQIYASNIAGSTLSTQTVQVVNLPVVTGASATRTFRGAQLTLFGSELQHVDTVRFFGGAGGLATILSKTPTALTLTVPTNPSAPVGQLYIANLAGSVFTALTIEIANPPVPTIVSATLVRRGDTLRINGTNLQYVDTVRFFGSTGVQATIASQASTQIATIVPATASGIGSVYVANIAGGVLTPQTVEIAEAPVLTGVNTVRVRRNGQIILTGENLQHVTSVRFFGASGAEASIINKNATQLTAQVPNTASGIGQIYVQNIVGNALTPQIIEIVNAPTITNISSTLTRRGAAFTITGTNLQYVDTVRFFGASGAQAVITTTSTTSLEVVVPANPSSASGKIYIANIAGNVISVQTVEVVNTPAITAVSTTMASRGSSLTLTGLNLQHIDTVRFFGATGNIAQIQSKSATQVIVTVPTTANGSGQIYAVNIAGSTLSSQTVEIVNAPLITGISTSLTVTGATFTLFGTDLQHVDTVRFFGNSGRAAQIQSKSATQIVVTVPSQASARSGRVYVTNIGGNALTSEIVEIVNTPQLTGVSTLITVTGATFTLSGTDLQHVDTVRFFGATGNGAQIQSKSATQVVVTVPTGITVLEGNVYVANMRGSTLSSQVVQIATQPVITGITPLNVQVGGQVTLTGQNLQTVTSVRMFGTTGTEAEILSKSFTQLIVQVPTQPSALTGVVTVQNAAGIAQAPQAITIEPMPLQLYWAKQSSPFAIGRVALNNPSVVDSTFIPTSVAPLAVVADIVNGYIYWLNGSTSVGRATINGGSVTPNYITGLSNAASLALDVQNGQLYIGRTTGAIGRVQVNNPASLNQNFITGAGNVNILAFESGFLYIGDKGTNVIRRVAASGGTPTVILQTASVGTGLRGMTVDATSVYWYGSSGLRRATLTGANPTTILTAPTFTGQVVEGLTIQGGRLYWGEINSRRVRRVALNGSGLGVFASNIPAPYAVTIGKDPNAVVPTITSFTPTAMWQGGEVVITGNGFGSQTNTFSVQFGGVEAESYTVVSNTEIRARVANGASGAIEVQTVGGAASATGFTFIPAPVVTSVSAIRTITGATLTLTGTNLGFVQQTRFFGANGVLATPSSVSTTAVQVVVPTGVQTTSGQIFVSGSNGTTLTQSVEIISPPIITAVSTTLTRAGGEITLTGHNLRYVQQVRFFGETGALGTIIQATETLLRVQIPASPSAPIGRVFVANIAGTALSPVDVEVVAAPVISSLSETLRTTGETITITGQHLQFVSTVRFFGATGTPAQFTVVSSTQITATVPAGIRQREGLIYVENFVGNTVSPSSVRLVQTPIITAVNPLGALPGAVISLAGDDFDRVDEVRFFGANGIVATIVSKTRNNLNVTVPFNLPVNSGRIFVRNSVGSALSPLDFRLIVLPTVTDVQPRRAAAGETVTLRGTSLADITVVRLFGANGTPATIISQTPDSLRFTVPNGVVSDSGFVFVANSAGSTSASQQLSIMRAPVLDSISPVANIVGGTVSLFGANLADIQSVRFFGVTGTEAQIVSRAANRIDVLVPANANAEFGRIRITSAAGFAQSATDFRIILVPVISSVTPTLVATGQTLTITGNRLEDVLSVRFFSETGVQATILSRNRTEIRVQVPSGITQSSGRIWLNNLAGNVQSAQTVSIMPVPRITSISTQVGLPNSNVTLNGTNLQYVEQVRFFGVNGALATIISRTATSLVVRVPSAVSDEEGRIMAIAPSGQAEAPVNYRVILQPSITALTPERAPVNTVIAITGNRFSDVTEVRFFAPNGTMGQIVNRTSTQILVRVPNIPAPLNEGRIYVINAAGIAISPQIFGIIRQPVLTGLTPSVAPVDAVISLFGDQLADITAVRFYGTTGTMATIVNRATNRLDVRVPSGVNPQTGRIYVVNAAGNAFAPSDFKVMRVPVGGTVTPALGIAGDIIRITGNNLAELAEVRFFAANGVPGVILTRTETFVDVRVPVQPSGITQGTLFLINNAGTSQTQGSFRYLLKPVITSFTPTSAISSATVTLQGNFEAISSVRFFAPLGAQAEIISSSATQLQVRVPTNLTVKRGRIYVLNRAGNTPTNVDFELIIPVPPELPIGLAWQNITDFTMDAVWQPAATGFEAISFDFEVYSVGIGGSDRPILVQRVSATSPRRITVPNLLQGRQYQFRVRGINSAGLGQWAFSPIGLTLDNRPGRPRNPIATDLQLNGFTARWTNLNDGGTPLVYRIEVFRNGVPQTGTPALRDSIVAPATNRIIATGLLDDTDYYFRVRAENQFGASAWTVSPMFTTVRDMRRADSLALVALYNALGGDGWRNRTNWRSATVPLDQWYGVTVQNNRVTAIVLPANNLNGTIPANLGGRELQALERLIIWGNNISGAVPASLGVWRNLVHAELDHNRFNAVAANLSQHRQLQILRLDANNLTTFPATLLQITNSPMQILRLDRNAITSLPGRIENFPNLRGLWLNHNSISGQLAGNFILRTPQLETIFLNENRLTDVPSFTDLTLLRRVIIHRNNISVAALGRNSSLIAKPIVNYISLPQRTLKRREMTVTQGENVALEPSQSDDVFGFRWYYKGEPIAELPAGADGIHWLVDIGNADKTGAGEYECELFYPQVPSYRFLTDVVDIRTIGTVSVDNNKQPITGKSVVPQLFPTPARDFLTLRFGTDEKTDVAIEVIDIAGKNVLTAQYYAAGAGEHSTVLDVSKLASGSYRVVIKISEKVIVLNAIIIR